jgi:hypothetical protein
MSPSRNQERINIKVQDLEIAHWTLLDDHHVRFLNVGIINNLEIVKLNATLDELGFRKHCSRNARTLLPGIILISGQFHHELPNIASNLTQPFHLFIKQNTK